MNDKPATTKDALSDHLTLIRKREVQQAFNDGLEAGFRNAHTLADEAIGLLREVKEITDDDNPIRVAADLWSGPSERIAAFLARTEEEKP